MSADSPECNRWNDPINREGRCAFGPSFSDHRYVFLQVFNERRRITADTSSSIAGTSRQANRNNSLFVFHFRLDDTHFYDSSMNDGEYLPTLQCAIAGTPRQANGNDELLVLCFQISNTCFHRHSMRGSECPPTLRSTIVSTLRQANSTNSLFVFHFRI